MARGVVRPQDGRSSNLGLLTTALYDNPGLSRADLARLLGLSRVAVSDLVADLLELGVVVETGVARSGAPGKRATKLQIADDWRDIVVLDMSGTRSVQGALFGLHGTIRRRVERPLSAERGQAALDVMVDTIRDLLDGASRPIIGVGVGTPGVVDAHSGVVTSTNLGWQRVRVGEFVREAVGLPVDVGNDAHLAALAERRFQGASDDFIRMQISRGVGAGLVIAGQLVHGRHGGAGEIGHVVVDRRGGTCSCGKVGCLETWVSLPALQAMLDGAEDRDAVLAEAGTKLGQALSFVVAMTETVDIVLGGPPELLDGPFREAAERTLNASIRIEGKTSSRMSLSSLGGDAVLLGAVALVLKRHLGIH